ncbi:ATPase, T2SS/T4P/T4SS family [Maledivibacter halophilus]|uniref:Pilus assembly protein, ATPase of CpaF family n=1 Tax=Maledivibacter halophilus TaxID=36842 RepID=A0A1T5MF41_9FIRM|nr:ATPase, T2SS/T4P/T4SS family [Maledivibacter halophilus]SKC86861.1 Pilus assembly protein, ATPase of CpaF family [Maledivibacter halophilus]
MTKKGFENEVAADIQSFIYERKSNVDQDKTVKGKKKHGTKTKEEAVNEVREYLKSKYLEEFQNITNNKEAYLKIEKAIETYVNDNGLRIEGIENTPKVIATEIKQDLLNLGVLTDLLFPNENKDDIRDEYVKELLKVGSLEEVQVDDWNDIRLIIGGKRYRTNLSFNNANQAQRIAERIVRNGHSTGLLSKDNPVVKCRIGNNIRATIVRDPIARRPNDMMNPVTQMAIRKQVHHVIKKEQLLQWKTIDEYGDSLLELLIKYGARIGFYGGTNTGKTGTMGSYIHRIPKNKRWIVLAETDEMNARLLDENGKAKNSIIVWEIKPGVLGFRDAIITALTFSPEGIVVQEIKGEEAVELITAAITGHPIVTTLHALNINVFGKRILTMYKQSGSDLDDDLILDLTADAFDIAVNMAMLDDGSRKIVNISEINGYDRTKKAFDTTTLVEYEIEDTYEVPAVDPLGNPVIDPNTKQAMEVVIKGRHVIKNPISEKLVQQLMMHGALKADLEKFTDVEFLKKNPTDRE